MGKLDTSFSGKGTLPFELARHGLNKPEMDYPMERHYVPNLYLGI